MSDVNICYVIFYIIHNIYVGYMMFMAYVQDTLQWSRRCDMV